MNQLLLKQQATSGLSLNFGSDQSVYPRKFFEVFNRGYLGTCGCGGRCCFPNSLELNLPSIRDLCSGSSEKQLVRQIYHHPRIITDTEGLARISFPLPQTSGRIRIRIVGSDGGEKVLDYRGEI